MTNPTFSTLPLSPTAEAVKGAGTPQEPPRDSHDLRLFGGGGTGHYAHFGLPVPPFEVVLAATLHRLHSAATPFSVLSPSALFERSSHDELLAVVRQQVAARERSAGQ